MASTVLRPSSQAWHSDVFVFREPSRQAALAILSPGVVVRTLEKLPSMPVMAVTQLNMAPLRHTLHNCIRRKSPIASVTATLTVKSAVPSWTTTKVSHHHLGDPQPERQPRSPLQAPDAQSALWALGRRSHVLPLLSHGSNEETLAGLSTCPFDSARTEPSWSPPIRLANGS